MKKQLDTSCLFSLNINNNCLLFFILQLTMFSVRTRYCKIKNTGLFVIIKAKLNVIKVSLECIESINFLCYPLALCRNQRKHTNLFHIRLITLFATLAPKECEDTCHSHPTLRPFRHHFCFLFLSHVIKQNSSLFFRQLISWQLSYANDQK